MRPGEVEGKDYYFVSKEQFEEWIAGEQLLEHALVYGEYKGIPRGQVDAALQRGADVVLRIDVQVSQQNKGMGLVLSGPPSCVCLAKGGCRGSAVVHMKTLALVGVKVATKRVAAGACPGVREYKGISRG
jgi:hypothetical protein